ncbi:hypothetical protein HMPREF1982_03091 [Clostridiales bacterium oral taxon 876 str. F0540]|nr:hypothetical protein HMPREF1982_03091 [Clostridiales bacterium oral taxon 876 str. F0540]
MWNKFDLVDFIQSCLPVDAVILAHRDSVNKPAVAVKDIDNDGILEISALYRWQDEDYIIVLKNQGDYWYTMLNTKTNGQSVTCLLRNVKQASISLYPAPVRTVKGTKWGFINNKGDFIIKPKYDNAYDFQDNGLAVVEVNRLNGLINTKGNFVVEPKYDDINQFSEGRAVVFDNQGFRVIDEKGTVITKKLYNYIGSYKNERALFSNTDDKGNTLYGFLDRQGNEVIKAKYELANDFKNGKTVVKIKDKQYELIGINGETLNTFNYNYVGILSEGLMAFQKEPEGKYGFIDEQGKVVIEPQFQNAQNFQNGRAIINTINDYIYKYGLIDRQGNVIFKPDYDNMNILGENRVAVGRAIVPDKPFMGYKYALADINGKFYTDFIFNDISDFEGGLASATDNKNTFFIDRSGTVANKLPIVSGSGSLTIIGDVIRALVDLRTTYFDKAGNIIYRENTVIPLNDQYKVIEEKYKPNKDYLVYYPQIEGIKYKTVQQAVNRRLKELSKVKYVKPDVQLEASYTGDFSVEFFKKNLLVLELNGYDFAFGAAHGMPSRIYPHIDLISGRFYELKDLFKANSSYVKVLSDIIGKMIKTDPQYSYVFPDSYKGIKPNQPFYVDASNLYIYFEPYEIAPYAAGFPTFKIPFNSIMSIINTQGEFWKSFN